MLSLLKFIQVLGKLMRGCLPEEESIEKGMGMETINMGVGFRQKLGIQILYKIITFIYLS